MTRFRSWGPVHLIVAYAVLAVIWIPTVMFGGLIAMASAHGHQAHPEIPPGWRVDWAWRSLALLGFVVIPVLAVAVTVIVVRNARLERREPEQS